MHMYYNVKKCFVNILAKIKKSENGWTQANMTSKYYASATKICVRVHGFKIFFKHLW